MTTSESMHPTAPNLQKANESESMQLNEFVVLKIGGSILENLHITFFEEIIYLLNHGWYPIIVHGGGPSITSHLTKLGVSSSFINGLRVTDEKTLDVVQMILNGKENTEIVRKLTMAGGKGLGLSGVDNQMIIAEPLHSLLGYVGKVKHISFSLLADLQKNKIIPVISPIAMDEQGQIFNINADTVAEEIAIHIQANKLFFISDVSGIYLERDGGSEIVPTISFEEIEDMKKNNEITGGMIPKVEAAMSCIRQGVEEVYIMDGLQRNSLRRAFHQEFTGTKIIKTRVM